MKILRTLFCLGATVSVWSGTSNAQNTTLPVGQFSRVQNCSTDHGTIRLNRSIVSGPNGIVVLEPPEAKNLELQAGEGRIGYDATDRSRYVHFVKNAKFEFRLKIPGNYRIWYRASIPFKGNWLHEERMDQGSIQTVYDKRDDHEIDRWQWLEGPVYDLKAGNHEFTLCGYNGGIRLNKIVLAPPSFTPQGKGAAASYEPPVNEGRVETAVISPSGLTRWLTFQLTQIPAGGSVKVQYSPDNGKTWKPMPADGNLQSIPVSPRMNPGLKLAFVLTVDADGICPVVQNPVLEYAGARPYVLANGKIELTFSSQDGRLIGLKNLQTGQPYLISRVENPVALIGLGTIKNKNLSEYNAPELKEQHLTARQLVQRYHFAGGKILATLTVRLDDSEKVSWDVEVNNRGDEPVAYVDFPRLNGLRIGPKGEDDYLFVPFSCASSLYKNPGNNALLYHNSKWIERGFVLKMIDLWDAGSGLYVASLDPTFRDTSIRIDQGDKKTVQLAFRKFCYIPTGKTWNSQPYCLAAHRGDWHWAGDEYRTWACRYVKSPDNPRWLKEEFDGFVASLGRGIPVHGFTNVVRAVRYGREVGGVVDMNACREGFDSNAVYCSLYPYPNPSWGGVEEFTQTNDLVKQFGGHTIWYVNWMLYHPLYGKTPRIATQARTLLPANIQIPSPEWLDRNAALSPAGDYSHPSPSAVYYEATLCNASPDVRDYHAYWAQKMVGDFKADGVYWDCLLDAYSMCWSPVHCGDLGQWSNGTTRSLKNIIEKTRPLNSHAFYAGEQMGDINTGQYENIHMGCTARGTLSYICPEWVIVGGGTWGPGEQWTPEQCLSELYYGHLTGARFLNPDVVSAGGRFPKGISWDYGLKILSLRRQIKQVLYPAVYKDTVGLEVELPGGRKPDPYPEAMEAPVYKPNLFPIYSGVLAARFALRREGTAVEIVNTLNTEKVSGGRLKLTGADLPDIKKAWLFNLNDDAVKECNFKKSAHGVEIDYPSAPVSSLVLVDRCEPMLYVQAPPYGTWNTTIPVKVSVLNLNSSSIEGELSLNLPEGFTGSTVKYGPIEPGMKKEYVLNLRPSSGLKSGRHDLDVQATGVGGKARRLTWVYIDQPLRAVIDENPTRLGLDIELENFASKALSGYCELMPDDQFKTLRSRYDFSISPGCKTTVTVPLELKKPLVLPDLAKVRMVYGDWKKELVKSVRPALANGDFEIDLAKDGHPDYWMGLVTGGHLTYDQYRLDGSQKYAGRYGLCIDPPVTKGTTNLAFNLSCKARLGKKYHYRVAIKRQVASEAVYATFKIGTNTVWAGVIGKPGRWEVFEGTIVAPAKNPSGYEYSNLGMSDVMVYNGSSGKAWFDAICLEETKE